MPFLGPQKPLATTKLANICQSWIFSQERNPTFTKRAKPIPAKTGVKEERVENHKYDQPKGVSRDSEKKAFTKRHKNRHLAWDSVGAIAYTQSSLLTNSTA
jgi:hypothetical protein